jgi:hypothetical protein
MQHFSGEQSMAHRFVRPLTCVAAIAAALFCVRGPEAWSQVTNSPGINELVIMDPGVHERGLPSVELKYLPGGQQIDIPPKVHVHRYYYSGDKIFQGPIIQGGPTVLVANHPKTGEQLYVDVVLPAGAPRIQHTAHSIIYIYSKRRVEIKFRHFPFDSSVAMVKHHSGKGIGVAVADKHEHVHEHVKEKLASSTLVNSIKETGSEGADFVGGVKTGIGKLATKGSDSIITLSNLIPGMTYIKSLREQGPQQQYEATVERAGTKAARKATPFVRTNQ